MPLPIPDQEPQDSEWLLYWSPSPPDVLLSVPALLGTSRSLPQGFLSTLPSGSLLVFTPRLVLCPFQVSNRYYLMVRMPPYLVYSLNVEEVVWTSWDKLHNGNFHS